MKPIYIHSGMAGAPQYANADGNINGILEACLVNGFNTKTATSASAIGGVLTLNFASNPGFEALQTVEVAVADVALVNGQHRVVANTNNQVTIAIPGLPDGAVASSGAGITIKQAGAGWSKPFSSSTVAVFRPPAGNRRFLRCVHNLNVDFSARGYEEMTDIDAGTGPFPTLQQDSVAQAIYNRGYSAVVNAPWFLIATDKWVVFSLADTLIPNYGIGTLFFGDIAEQVKAGDVYSTMIGLTQSKYIARSHTGAEGATIAALNIDSVYGAAWPSVIDNGFRLIPYMVVTQSGAVMRGVLPNTYKLTPYAPSNHFFDLLTNVSGVVGRVKLVILYNFTGPITTAISLDEEAWL